MPPLKILIWLNMTCLVLFLITYIDNGGFPLIDDFGCLGIGDFRPFPNVRPCQCADTIKNGTDKNYVVSNKIHEFILPEVNDNKPIHYKIERHETFGLTYFHFKYA